MWHFCVVDARWAGLLVFFPTHPSIRFTENKEKTTPGSTPNRKLKLQLTKTGQQNIGKKVWFDEPQCLL